MSLETFEQGIRTNRAAVFFHRALFLAKEEFPVSGSKHPVRKGSDREDEGGI